MTDAETAEYKVLKLANEHGKLAFQLGFSGDTQSDVDALEGLQIRRWITLIDITPLTTMDMPGIFFRVFLVSPEAMTWFRAQS
jgi:hypothetical protein